MKKLLLGTAGLALACSGPAFGQTVNGTINITGTVTSKCAVVQGGTTSATFTDNVDLGELDQADGTLEQSSILAGRFKSTATNATPAFRVVCNTATPKVAVDATELTTGGTAATGYANRVDYVAHVTVAKAAGGTTTIDNATTGAATGATAVGGAISGAAGNNVTVTADTFTTPTTGALLVAGSYTGSIAITITPS